MEHHALALIGAQMAWARPAGRGTRTWLRGYLAGMINGAAKTRLADTVCVLVDEETHTIA